VLKSEASSAASIIEGKEGLTMRFHCYSMLLVLCLALPFGSAFAKEAEQPKKIDASDPTRIYTYIGVGPKYTRYANGEHMIEGRVSGNIGMQQDMVFFNIGYGRNKGTSVPGPSSGATNGRIRWFHLFEMDYNITHGYRGWASQVDLQIAGSLKGTLPQNVLSLGGVIGYGLNERWSLFLMGNVVNGIQKHFKHYNGMGLGFNPLLVCKLDDWWEGGYIQFWPGYVRFLSGRLKGTGSSNLDFTLGGKITPTVTWTWQNQINGDKSLRRRKASDGLANDWNTFFYVTTYF